MENFEIDILVIKDAIEKKKLEEENQRPFLQLEIEDYPEVIENKNLKEEPRRVIIIDIWLLYYKKRTIIDVKQCI